MVLCYCVFLPAPNARQDLLKELELCKMRLHEESRARRQAEERAIEVRTPTELMVVTYWLHLCSDTGVIGMVGQFDRLLGTKPSSHSKRDCQFLSISVVNHFDH